MKNRIIFAIGSFLLLLFVLALCPGVLHAQVPQNVQKLSGTLTQGFHVGTGTTVDATGSGVLHATSLDGGTASSLTALSIRSTGAAHDLVMAIAEAISADRTLTWVTGNASRTITLSGNPTLGDWFDQAVKTGSSPTFAAITSLGTPLSVANGGTGAATFTTNAILKGNGTSAVQASNLTASTSANVTTVSSTTGNEINLQTLDNDKPITIAPNGVGSINLAQGVDLEFTGNLISPIAIQAVSPTIIVPETTAAGRATWLPPTGTCVGSIVLNGGITGDGPITLIFHGIVQCGSTTIGGGNTGLTTVSFPDLVSCTGTFGVGQANSLTSLTAPNLKYAAGFSVTNCSALTSLDFPELVSGGWVNTLSTSSLNAVTTWNFPKLKYWGTAFIPGSMSSLTSMSCPLLEESGNATTGFAPTTMAALTTFDFPAYRVCRGPYGPTTMAALPSITMNAMTTVTGNFSVANMASLTTLSYTGMVTYGGTITCTTGLGALSTVTLGTIGTLKTVTGPTVTFSGAALSQASVDGILKLLASLDGTSGTTSYGTGQTLTLSGGTNASPTTTGTTATTPAGSSFVGVGTTCTATITSHGLSTGDIITTTGITTLTNANVTAATVTVLNANQFTFSIVSQTATGAGTASMHSTPAAGTDGFHACQVIRLRGAAVATALGF